MLLGQKNLIGNLKKSSFSQQSACQNYGTVVMAGNGTFQQKSIRQYRKIFITQPKHMLFY